MAQNKAYEEGYQDGLKCGKLCAAQQILDDLEEILTAKLETFNKLQEDPSLAPYHKPEPEYWNGRAVTCGEILRMITTIKKGAGL